MLELLLGQFLLCLVLQLLWLYLRLMEIELQVLYQFLGISKYKVNTAIKLNKAIIYDEKVYFVREE